VPDRDQGFQALAKDFADEGVAIIGVSTDSFYSHKSWFTDRKTFPDQVTHPVLADTSYTVSRRSAC
jgi:alkyl hydroperoxide reductase subunit AhpC